MKNIVTRHGTSCLSHGNEQRASMQHICSTHLIHVFGDCRYTSASRQIHHLSATEEILHALRLPSKQHTDPSATAPTHSGYSHTHELMIQQQAWNGTSSLAPVWPSSMAMVVGANC